MKKVLLVILAALMCIQMAACSSVPTECTHDFSQFVPKQEYDALVEQCDIAQNELNAAKTNYDTIKSDYNTAKTQYEETKAAYDAVFANMESTLAERDAALINYETAKTEYDTIKAEYDAAKAEYEILQINYEALMAEYEVLKKYVDEHIGSGSSTPSTGKPDDEKNKDEWFYLHDKWNLYKAVKLSDTVIKIENWGRFNAGEGGDPFKYEYDVCVISTTDNATDFRWLDESYVAFSITLKDEENSYMDGAAKVCFTIEAGEDAELLLYQHDKWNLYKAVKLSDTVIKIENWGRFNAGEDGDPFKHEYDVCVISTTDNATDFKWLDDKHTAFSITMHDAENSYWAEPSVVYFTISTDE